jgi:hypothetical protein
VLARSAGRLSVGILLYYCGMPLLSIWNSNREAVLKMTVEQVVNNAGDGHLRDGNEASQELRGYLRICPSESLFNSAVCQLCARILRLANLGWC